MHFILFAPDFCFINEDCNFWIRLFIASLKILGPSPSNQVALNGSMACMYDCTCSDVTNRILK